MHPIIRLLATLAGLTAAVPAIAGESYSSVLAPQRDATELLLPHRGAYWDPAQPGSGYVIDISRSSGSVSGYFGFATLYTYREDGTSTFLVLQGDIEFATEAQRKAEGWIARLSSPLFQAGHGQPFGGTYRAPEVTPSSFGGGSITWATRRTAELRVGDRVTPIRVVSADTPETEAAGLLSGYWLVQARLRANNTQPSSHPSAERYSSHVVKLVPVVPAPSWASGPGAPAGATGTPWMPTSGVLTFEAVCVADCFPANQTVPFASPQTSVTYNARVWIDPATLRASWVYNAQASGQTSPQATQNVVGSYFTLNFDLLVDDDTIIGRGAGITTGQGSASTPAGVYPGSELLLTRISPNGLHAPEGRFTKIY